jgi:hypothetical protein
MEYLPSKFVIAALLVPFSLIDTEGSGSPVLASETIPVTFCAMAENEKNVAMARANIFALRFMNFFLV